MTYFKQRPLWSMLLLVSLAFIGVVALPVSNTPLRAISVLLLLAGWGLLTAILWRFRWLRVIVVALPILCVGLIAFLPGRQESPDFLRHGFLTGLRRYEGVRYYWGGEGFTGIDCSGLIRRGLIDSLLIRGIRTQNVGLVRDAVSLWWHDCSARDLGEGLRQLTVPVVDTPNLNSLDHSRIIAGDLAVTRGGEHVMAYLGEKLWIEADPAAARVITVAAPSKTNAWFHGPMKIVRWSCLNQ